LYLALVNSKLPKIVVSKVFDNDWTNRVTKICANVEFGSRSYALSFCRWIFGFGFLLSCILVVTFTLRQRVDLIDGARITGAFLMALVLALGALAASLYLTSFTVNKVIKASEDKERGPGSALTAAFRVCMVGGASVAFLTVGTAFCAFCGTYLFMSLDRGQKYTDATAVGDGVFSYGNRCISAGNGSFCGQTLSLASTCGFALCLSFIAMMLKSITGICSKAAEIGNELVDRVESATVDQLHNPAHALDFVGSLSVELGGQAADCMESIVLSVLAAAFLAQGDSIRLAIPFWIAGFGLFSALVAALLASVRDPGGDFSSRHASLAAGLKSGLYVAAVLTLALSAVTIGILYPRNYPYTDGRYPWQAGDGGYSEDLSYTLGTNAQGWKLFAVIAIGLASGHFAWESTAYFTGHRRGPTQSVAAAGLTGAATHLIQGLGIGMLSCLPTAVVLAADVIGCHAIAGQYGVALSAVATAAPLAYGLAAAAAAPIAYAASSLACGSDAPQVRPAGGLERIRRPFCT
jgi:Na+/H+-translocating membrane pyrophosphatase